MKKLKMRICKTRPCAIAAWGFFKAILVSLVGVLCFSGDCSGYGERPVYNGSIQGGDRAICLWSYPYVVSSDFVWILFADSNSETDKRKKRNIAVLPDSMEHIPVPDTDPDGYFWADNISGTD